MKKSASFPAALGTRSIKASKSKDDENELDLASASALLFVPPPFTSTQESRLFGSKTKSTPQDENNRSSWDFLVNPKKNNTTHRRAKSEIIARTVVETQDEQPEMPELPRNTSPAGTILIRKGARKTVDDVFDDSTVHKSLAKSVQLGVCYDLERCNSNIGSLDGDQGAAEEKDPDARSDSYDEDCTKYETKLNGSREKGAPEAEGTNANMFQNPVKNEDTPPESPEDEGDEQFQDCYFPFTMKPRRDGFPDSDYVPPNSLVDKAISNGVWGLNPSNLIIQEHERELTGLPNCTASRHTKNWQITNSTLVAYSAMRGPYRLAGRDMFVWMDRCGKTFLKPEECGEDVGSCNSIIADLEPLCYDPPPLGDESNRKQVFSIPRPPYEHIKPPLGFNPENHEEPSIELDKDFIKGMKNRIKTWTGDGNGDGLDQVVDPDEMNKYTDEFVISDDEGETPKRRISPYAHGASDVYHRRLAELTASKEINAIEASAQGDAEADSATSSLDYVLTGYTAKSIPIRFTEWHRELLGRRDATTTSDPRQHAVKDAGVEVTGSISSHDPMPYTEVLDALAAEDARVVNGISPQEAPAVIRQRHDTLEKCLVVEKKAFENIAAAEKRISLREAQLDRVSASVNMILEMKTRKPNRRRGDIYRHVSQHLRELNEKAEVKYEETWELALQLASLLTKEKELEMKMKEEAQKVGVDGLSGADEIEAVVQRLLESHGAFVNDADNSFF
ncbi:hypothetical protein G7Z17_g11669 [Cylindrodendrum hubeiense]|uniref:Uncharacterized protein n=1 Tax=Cylindrodendrum hubeiense TaxID=595255 RepID=A0A9P5LB26_9HYPO|nr:hypothetical protein G7Z17_g11669 [Cylindrodendrum hubeiense]